MSILLQILLANFVTRGITIMTATLLSYRWLARLSEQLLAVACGLMIAIAMTHLIPEAFSHSGVCPESLGWFMLATVIFFLLVERVLLIGEEHAHAPEDGHHGHVSRSRTKSGVLAMMTASGLHNFVDGVLVASTFMVSTGAGWLIAVAVMMHEIPQTTGYMVILKSIGIPQKQAFFICVLAAAAAVAGGAFGWYAVSIAEGILPYALAISAASFLFITFHCLLPEVFHECTGPKKALMQFCLLIAGVLLSVLLIGGHHHHGHQHSEETVVSPAASEEAFQSEHQHTPSDDN